MRRMTALAVALLFAAAIPAAAQTSGSGQPTGPDEPQTHLNTKLAPINLDEAQQQQIRAALAGKQNQVEFKLKTTKPLKNFQPAVGVKAPPHLPTQGFPVSLTQKLPQLHGYKYCKFNGQLLVINPMTKTIVSVFALQKPPSA